MSEEEASVSLPPRLLTDLKRAASALMSARTVDVITHIDADGITAGAIAAETLRRLGKTYTLSFEKKITEETVEKINNDPSDYVWICDLGSAYMGQFTRSGIVVTDHHVPDTKWRSGQSMLDAFSASYQINPHLYGASGSYEVSGAGMTYLLSRAIDPNNTDLAYLAVIGAIGDFQDSRESKLVGWNRVILQDAVDRGDMVVSYGIRFFGRGTRPLVQFLQYGEPAIPGISGDSDACYGLLNECQVPAANSDGIRRTWCDLDPVESAMLTDELVSRAKNDEDRTALLGELYTVKRYDFKTGLGDAK
ncbi:MAG: DHH family phosphoesterase, partial [Candidatus Methanomethylophilus sp.]|nr:DHH family phosphoesterase [Methanomethylophilus sp.]